MGCAYKHVHRGRLAVRSLQVRPCCYCTELLEHTVNIFYIVLQSIGTCNFRMKSVKHPPCSRLSSLVYNVVQKVRPAHIFAFIFETF